MKNKTIAELIRRFRSIGAISDNVAVTQTVDKLMPQTLSAFSNGSGGLIIVGLSKTVDFTATKSMNATKEQSRLISACCKLTPVVKPEIDFLEFEGNTILVAEISELPAKKKPCFITKVGMYGGSYVRLGDHNIRIGKNEVDELVSARKLVAWDEEPVEGAAFGDLEKTTLKPYLAKRKAQRKRTFADGTEDALQRLGIMAGNHPTMAGELVFGKYPQQFFPRLVVVLNRFSTYKLDPRENLLDHITFEGTIPEIVTATVTRIEENAHLGRTGSDADNFGAPNYPREVLQEAILNAILHRSYSPQARALPIRVNMYPDRIEFTSPGGLHHSTMAELKTEGFVSTRNLRLATILGTLEDTNGVPLVTNSGNGLAKMRLALNQARMPQPEFAATATSFTLTLRRGRLGPIETEPSALDRVETYIESKQSAGTSQVVEALGLSRTSVQNSINKLIEEGKIEATQPFRSPRQTYRIKR